MRLLQAVELEPSNCSYSLNYIHALELDQQHDNILKEVARFCTRCGLQLGGELRSLEVGAPPARCFSLPWPVG